VPTATTPASPAPAPYAELRSLLRQAATLGSVGSLLGWDQETYMPAAGAAHRAEQQAMLSALVHERGTSPRVGELLAKCESDPALRSDEPAWANLREMRREYDLATKVPTELVAELARTGSLSQEAWKEAREKSDFARFAPWLEKMIALTRRKAECLKSGQQDLYDALLDQYEPGMTGREIASVFDPLRTRLASFIADIAQRGREPDTTPLNAKVPAEKQHAFGQRILEAMGFDLRAGRLDVTTHPFCSGMAPGDTRLTTRYRDEKFTDALYGTMHEAGHGLYEQGLPKADHFGEPLGDAVSLGIHESQSRMWENFVGRSREFWVWALPVAQQAFAVNGQSGLDGVTVDAMYRAVNTCRPSFIRVEADESTYNLHVMLRFEVERALVNGTLGVNDVPRTWNAKVKEYLGLDVPDDRRGCLQDVHWSFGLVGYFPTYTLGNLYAAQFWEKILADLPGLKTQMSQGNFGELKRWLNTNIHAHGKRYRAADLCKRITGKPLSADPFMRHLEGKIKPIYGI
jgi:carboxypeptidase Taq